MHCLGLCLVKFWPQFCCPAPFVHFKLSCSNIWLVHSILFRPLSKAWVSTQECPVTTDCWWKTPTKWFWSVTMERSFWPKMGWKTWAWSRTPALLLEGTSSTKDDKSLIYSLHWYKWYPSVIRDDFVFIFVELPWVSFQDLCFFFFFPESFM